MGRRGSMVKDSAEACDVNGVGNVNDSPPSCEGVEAPSENILPSLKKAENFAWNKDLNIYQRLIHAQHDANAIKPKQSGQKYDYQAHDDVMAEAKRILNKNGILFFPTVNSMKQDENNPINIIMSVSCTFINADDPDEEITTISYSYGLDKQDKGPGKAYSYAVKFALQKALMLNTGEDLETQSIEYTPTQIAQKTEHEIKSWFKSFSDQIDHTQSYEQLKKLKTDNTAMLKSPAVPDTTKEAILEKLDAKIDLAKEVLLQDEVI